MFTQRSLKYSIGIKINRIHRASIVKSPIKSFQIIASSFIIKIVFLSDILPSIMKAGHSFSRLKAWLFSSFPNDFL
jgi:hypothetical protein